MAAMVEVRLGHIGTNHCTVQVGGLNKTDMEHTVVFSSMGGTDSLSVTHENCTLV